jgi:hypothetical protein
MTATEQIEERENNFLNELKHPKFHSEEKGCEIERIKTPTGYGYMENIICHTHNVKCSKSGWELGYYLGQRSKDVYDPSEKNQKYERCSCGKRYKENGKGMCIWCYNEAHPELFYEKKLRTYRLQMFNAKRMALMREGLSYHVATAQAREWVEEKIKTINVKDL